VLTRIAEYFGVPAVRFSPNLVLKTVDAQKAMPRLRGRYRFATLENRLIYLINAFCKLDLERQQQLHHSFETQYDRALGNGQGGQALSQLVGSSHRSARCRQPESGRVGACSVGQSRRELAEGSAVASLASITVIGAHPRYRLAPGHFGRDLGSMNSPPKRSRNCSACARSAKQKTITSASLSRNECVWGHSESGSQKRRMVM